jgi:hypothetical protein
VGRSGNSRWNTRRGTRTTPQYSPISTPELHRLPLGIPAGVLGKVKNATPTHGLIHFFSAARPLVGGGFQSAKARVYGNFLMRNISFYGNN